MGKASKVSFHIGNKNQYSISHNDRSFDADKWNKDGHIDFSKEHINIIEHLKNTNWNKWCEDTFGDAIDRFNEKNKDKHKDRLINKDEFYRKCKSEVREAIIQVGNEDYNPLDDDKHKEWLYEALEQWQKDNPNLVVVGAYMHFDETTPHLHLDFLPLKHPTRGLAVQVSYEGALKEQGIATDGKYENSYVRQLLDTERKKLESIASKYCTVEESDHTTMKHHKETYMWKAEQEQNKVKELQQERIEASYKPQKGLFKKKEEEPTVTIQTSEYERLTKAYERKESLDKREKAINKRDADTQRISEVMQQRLKDNKSGQKDKYKQGYDEGFDAGKKATEKAYEPVKRENKRMKRYITKTKEKAQDMANNGNSGLLKTLLDIAKEVEQEYIEIEE